MPVRCRPRFPSRNRRFPDRCRSPDCASTAFRCRCLLLRQKLFVLPRRRLRNNYTSCPTGTPTFAALRRQRRDLIIATRPAYQPLPSLLSAAAAQEVQAIHRTDNDTRRTNSARSAPPNLHDPPRAKGSLDRRSKRLSFPHFFLRRKKCGRRRPPPRQGETDSPPQRQGLFRAPGAGTCLRRVTFVNSDKSDQKRRQKLRFCTSSARYACSPLSVFPHVTGVFLIVVVPPTVPAQLSAAAACYYGKNYSFCRVAG